MCTECDRGRWVGDGENSQTTEYVRLMVRIFWDVKSHDFVKIFDWE